MEKRVEKKKIRAMIDETAPPRRRLVYGDAQEYQLVRDRAINRRRTNGKYAKLCIKHEGLQVPGSVEFPPIPSSSPPPVSWRQAGWKSLRRGTSTLLPRLPRQTAWPPRLPVLVGEDSEKEMCSSDSGYVIGSGCMRPGGPADSM